MRNVTYVNIRYERFYLYQLKLGTDFIFQKIYFENLLKLESIINIFVFYIFVTTSPFSIIKTSIV